MSYLEFIKHRGNPLLNHKRGFSPSLLSPRLGQRKHRLQTLHHFSALAYVSLLFSAVASASWRKLEIAYDMTSDCSTNAPHCKRSHLLTGNGERGLPFSVPKTIQKQLYKIQKAFFHYTCCLRLPHLLPHHRKLSQIYQQN